MAEARVGPNAILQTIEALTEVGGTDLARRVFAAAGVMPLLKDPPREMVPEECAAVLHRTIAAQLPPEDAVRIAVDAGRRTGRYILQNRIPSVARAVLKRLPARFSGPMLLRAIERHAWTFAGSAEVSAQSGAPLIFTIQNNPLSIPECPWHCAVFETLFRELVSLDTRVVHRSCCAKGDPDCVFEIDIRRMA